MSTLKAHIGAQRHTEEIPVQVGTASEAIIRHFATMIEPQGFDSSSQDLEKALTASDNDLGISPTSVRMQFVIDATNQQHLIGKLSPEGDEVNVRRGVAVSFELELDNYTLKAKYIEPTHVLTDDDVQNQWWTHDEVCEIYEKARSVVSYFREYRSDYSNDFSRLFTMCCKSPKSLFGSPPIVDPLCHRAARGLERHIHDILPKYRNKFVGALLDIQSKTTSEMDPSLRARILQVKSLQLSKPSRILARHLAQQDSVDVPDLIREELAKCK